MDIPQLKKEILLQLPLRFRKMLAGVNFEKLQEIRFRCGRPIMLYENGPGIYITESGRPAADKNQAAMTDREDMASLMAAFCENSVYAYQREICDGFLTIRGGHRVGICGRCVMTDSKIVNITDISGLNLRIAKEFPGCADRILSKLCNEDTGILNTVLIGPPQCGKTTFLRDLCRLLSNRFKITVIDERSEIAAVKNGIPQFHVGAQTDVLDRFPKGQGMLTAVRSLSPEVIITDELGAGEDIAAVKSVLNAGCKIITSMHGYGVENLAEEKKSLLALFDCAIIMARRRGVPEMVQFIKIWQEKDNMVMEEMI